MGSWDRRLGLWHQGFVSSFESLAYATRVSEAAFRLRRILSAILSYTTTGCEKLQALSEPVLLDLVDLLFSGSRTSARCSFAENPDA